MPLVASALAPLVLLIGVGVALARGRFLADGFWPGLDRLNYWVFFPALILESLATSEVGLGGSGRVAVALWGGLAVVALAALSVRRVVARDGPAFTSVFQGAVRFNSYVAFLVVPVLYPGSDGAVALFVALTVPVVNVLAVLVLARFADAAALDGRTLLRSIASNPLIAASLLGIAANAVALPLGPVARALELLGQAALAAGLLSVGASLRFREAGRRTRPILASMALKFVALPLATFAFGVALALPPAWLGPLTLFQAMPTASASYVLARAMGGDERLMASILAVHTVAAIVTLPLAYAVLRAALPAASGG